VKNGVPMPPSLMAALDALATEIGISPLGK
jgi:hypothetical protein